VRIRQRVSDLLQVCLILIIHHLLNTVSQAFDGQVHFATDAWTSPNHHAYVAFTVHFLKDNQPFSLLLNFVEVDSVCMAFLLQLVVSQPLHRHILVKTLQMHSLRS
jgi:hypothetical protein